jgi:O-antigen ligase
MLTGLVSLLRETKSTLLETCRERGWWHLWESVLLPIGLPLLLGLGMGTLLAKFIVDANWPLVFGLILTVPALVLFVTRPFAAILIWIALMPFLQTTVTPASRIVYWLVHRGMPVGALAIVVLSAMVGVSKRQRAFKGQPAELAMGLFLGVAVLSVLRLHSSPLAHLYLLFDRLCVPMCLYLLVVLVAPGRTELQKLLPIGLVIVFVECCVVVLASIAPQLLPPEWLRLGAARGTGTLDNPYTYTVSLVFFSFLLYHGAMQRRPGLVRSLYLLGFGVGVFGLFLSFSRGAWLGSLAALAGLLLVYRKTAMRVLGLLALATVLLGGWVLTDQVEFARERLGAEDSAMDRLVIWDAGLQMVISKPLTGWGYDDYSLYAGQFQRRVQNYVAAYAHASHNAWMTIAAELGLPALLLYLVPVLWWLRLSFKMWKRVPRRGFWSQALLAILWLTLLNYAIITIFTDIRHSTYVQGIYWIVLGLIANMVTLSMPPDSPKSLAAQ